MKSQRNGILCGSHLSPTKPTAKANNSLQLLLTFSRDAVSVHVICDHFHVLLKILYLVPLPLLFCSPVKVTLPEYFQRFKHEQSPPLFILLLSNPHRAVAHACSHLLLTALSRTRTQDSPHGFHSSRSDRGAGQVLIRALPYRFSPASIIPPALHTFIYDPCYTGYTLPAIMFRGLNGTSRSQPTAAPSKHNL
jgi:hypothetical protein